MIFGPLAVSAGSQNQLSTLTIAPSPTRDIARIDFAMTREAHVRLSVLDVQGRRVAQLADAVYSPGHYQVTWDGWAEHGRAPAGLFFVRYESSGRSSMRRLVRVR